MDKEQTEKIVHEYWDSWYVDGLKEFIRVPNLSLLYDPEFATNGLIERAMDLVDSYVQRLEIVGLERQIFKKEGQNPLIVYVIAPTDGQDKNIMFYGHLDKMPYEEAWSEGFSPTEPVIINDRLFGRGSSDDGYAAFSCMLAVKTAQLQGAKMPRIVLVLETEEESGSPNLIDLLAQAAEFIRTPDVCFCLDSGCLDYQQLWMTSSLRGVAMVDLTVECGVTGYHSGEVGGLVPETFRIVRALLNRLDNVETGRVHADFHSPTPEWKIAEATELAASQGTALYDKFPLHPGVQCMHQEDLEELYLSGTWRPNLSITGAAGLPEMQKAGNVVRPATTVRLSMRLDPLADCKAAQQKMVEKLTTNVPYNAKVTALATNAGPGWCQKAPEPWLSEAIEQAGQAFFNKPAASYGEGGSIPFLKELEGVYPQTQIIAFGVGGPLSNAHAPNEMLDLPYAKSLTCCLAHIMSSCATNNN